ncbi:MAG: DUF2194 domain-containing protein [Bacteroidales bacterium]|nr:DUF2194 domain-containing protein [Lachnoclostridium sp.]MCM1383625.1 DUF2194 domain-containing protein [Lachnoclostridium sp.]MCM1465707.1 DUF2194 domain-containing protein [Bacteroidales bacterium]
MISRRNFFSICIMMAVLVFMFQFSQVFKAWGSNYNVNEYVSESQPSGQDKWQSADYKTSDKNFPVRDYVLFLGEKDTELWNVVKQWCTYTKKDTLTAPNTRGFELPGEHLPVMILIDSDAINFAMEMSSLLKVTQYGVPVVFCNLPEVSVIKKEERLQELLGIRRVKADTVRARGIQMYSGFLLGGEALYKVEKEEEEKLQDFNLEIPWYATGRGTKTYMVGLIDDEDTEREDFPSLIWRNSYNGTPVFAVCGDYLSDLAGLGILDSFVYETSSYELHPVVNACNVVVSDYPFFASENKETIQRIYGRDVKSVLRDIMWPGVSAMAEQNKLKLTCCMAPQYDYLDSEEPAADNMVFYLQQMKEIGAEAGKSLIYGGGIPLSEKMERDSDFLDNQGIGYRYGVVYTGKEVPGELEGKWEEGYLQDVSTLTCAYGEKYSLLSYYKDDVTLQCITGEATEYSYFKDLRARSISTALGYSNVLVDMHSAMWPEGKEQQWEAYFDKISSNVSTYWNKYKAFSRTTLSESDARVRTFLNLDYETSREGDRIFLTVTGTEGDGWFLLRTHGEDVVQAQNAEYEKLEESAYLIHTLSDKVELQVEVSGTVPQFLK